MSPDTKGFVARVASGEQLAKGPGSALVAEVVRKHGFVRLPAVGTSMVPAIHPGDLLLIQRVSLKEISQGDIIVYAQRGVLMVHRVVRVDRPYLITRGDRALRNDPKVRPRELIGRVTLIQRGHRSLNLPALPSAAEQALCFALRNSDVATYLYLRVSAFWREVSYKRLMCRV
jgi:signal peptidase I